MDRALETLVALAGLYLFLSLIAMAVVEGFSSLTHMRANHLKKGFDALLEGDAPRVLEHPLVKSLGRAAGRRGDIASYVPREIFSTATMDVIAAARQVAVIAGVRATALQKIAELSGHDPVVMKNRIETWFDAGMERVSGRFKRSIPSVSKSGAEVAAAFPIGWTSQTLRATFSNAAAIIAKLLGLFITFLAVCLGAPFWFDVLRRMAPGPRQSGTKPGEKPKPPPDPEPAAPAAA